MIDERGEIEKRLSKGLCPWCMQQMVETNEPNTRKCTQCSGTVIEWPSIGGRKAMTPEAKVKKKVAAHLKMLGAYYFYPVTGGYGKSGVPDIIGCYEGRFFGIECKAGKNKPTPLQEKNLSDIKANDGISLVINEDNIDDVLVYVGGKHRDPRQLELDFEGSPV